MLLRKTFASISSLFLLGFLAGCGGGGNTAVAPPTGGFTSSNLNGTYVFSTAGSDSSTGEPLMIVGAFTANGSGSISAGNVDVAAPGLGGFGTQAIGGGSGYSITADGRGQLHLTNTVLGTVTLDFVLQSTSHGSITEFDSNGSGSGTIDLQNSPTLGTAYAFELSGVANPGSTGTIIPFATAGAFTAGAGGVEDFNDGGGYTAATLSSATVTLGTGTAPGTATLVSSAATFNYDVYAIDSTHFKFIENDSAEFVSGDVFQQTTAQQTTLPSGTVAFTMAGLDTGGNPLALGGLLPVDGTGNIAAGLEDYNDGGTVGQATTVAGGFSALTGGRSQLSLTSFENGGGAILSSALFAAYPSSGGTLLLEIDGAGVTSGVAFVQSSTSLAASQGYGLNLAAENVSGGSGEFFEEDDVAEFTTSSSGFSGLIDLNDQGSTSFDKTLDGTYAVSNGRGTATFSDGTAPSATVYFDVVFYPVDGTNFLMIENDTSQIGTGSFFVQSTPGGSSSSSSVARPLFTPRRPMGHLARKADK